MQNIHKQPTQDLADLIPGDRVVLAAGGTGGHMFPAVALGQTLLKQGRKVILVTDPRGEQYVRDLGAIELKTLNLRQMSGLKSLIKFFKALSECWRWLGRNRPDSIVGFGGYPAFPLLSAAILRRIPIYLHEQNRVMGRVNRTFLPWAQKVGLSFPGTKRIAEKYNHKIVVTGLPVREPVKEAAKTRYILPHAKEKFRILVLGGSQGAGIFGDVLPKALQLLDKNRQNTIHLVQQCRKEQIDQAKQAYAQANSTIELYEFIDDIGQELAKAHLVISRAGASSTAELLTTHRPSILVPYLYATDDHQTANAQYAQAQGLSWVIPQKHFTAESLAEHINDLLDHPEKLSEAASVRDPVFC